MRLMQHTAIGLAVAAGGLTGCAIERAQLAHDAQSRMVGLTKEQVLSCMGVPAAKAAEGATEVRPYNSGNAYTTGSGFGISSRRYCTVNVGMSGGRVSRINYSGPTGALLSAGEQCAYPVQNCTR